MSFGKAGLKRIPDSKQKARQEGDTSENNAPKTLKQALAPKRSDSLPRNNPKPKKEIDLRASNTFSDQGGVNPLATTKTSSGNQRPPPRNPRVPMPHNNTQTKTVVKTSSTPRGAPQRAIGFGGGASRDLGVNTPSKDSRNQIAQSSGKKPLPRALNSVRSSQEIPTYEKPPSSNKRLGMDTVVTGGKQPGVVRPPKPPSTTGGTRFPPTGPRGGARDPSPGQGMNRNRSTGGLKPPAPPARTAGGRAQSREPSGGRFPAAKQNGPPAPVDKAKEGMFTDKPSNRIAKPGNPFAKTGKSGTQLGVLYDSGQVPCHVDYVGTKLKLTWSGPMGAEGIPFEPLLPALCEGIVETRHPLGFIAEQGVKDLLQSPPNPHPPLTQGGLQTNNAREKLRPILKQVVISLRGCFPPDRPDAYKRGLNVVKELATCAQEDLVDHLDLLLSKMSLKINDKTLRSPIFETLGAIEEHCGEGVRQKLKAKVPAYA